MRSDYLKTYCPYCLRIELEGHGVVCIQECESASVAVTAVLGLT